MEWRTSNVHLVVALSGRTDFKTGAYLETNNKDKSIFCPNAFDPVDTIRRTKHAIFYAINCMKNTSPLHTGAYWDSYWENNAEVRDRVSQRFSGMIEYSLNPGERLKTANIMVAGCDRDILGRPFGWKDAYCDMQAAVRYASKEELPHPPMKSLKVPTSPSIASSTQGRNIVNFFGHDRSDTLILRSTIAQSMRYLFHRPCESKKNTQEKVRNYKFDL